jgi:hypothetical protein
MSGLFKLIHAIKLRDIDQIKTILDENGELVMRTTERAQPPLHCAALDGFAKSSTCCSIEGRKSTTKTASLALHQLDGQSSICRRRAAFLAPSYETSLMLLSSETPGGSRGFWNAFFASLGQRSKRKALSTNGGRVWRVRSYGPLSIAC